MNTILYRIVVSALVVTFFNSYIPNVYARKKSRHIIKKNQAVKVQSYRDERGRYSVVFPPSHSKPIGDTSIIQSVFGSMDFYSYSTSGTHSASMVAYYDLSKENINKVDSSLNRNARVLLDTLQNQLLQNLNAKAQRRVKVVKEGLYHSRTTYFTAKGEKDATIYFRCENVYNPPRVYQLLFQSSKKTQLDSPEAKRFFQSFTITKSLK